MRLRSDPRRYATIPILLHWTIAGLVGLLAGTGLAMEGAEAATRLALLRVHAGAGAAVLALTLLRIAWWSFADRLPAAPAREPPARRQAARLVHRLTYAAILVLAASGIGTIMLAGAVPVLAGGGALPRFDGLPPRAVHVLAAWALLALIALHAGAALFHAVVLRDGLLASMGLGRPAAGDGA